MDRDFRDGLRAALLFALLPLVALLLAYCVVKWYFTSDIVANVHNTSTAIWYEGWLNGFLAGPTFVVSIFNHDYGIYRSNNTGVWYNFWYLTGISSLGLMTTTVRAEFRRQ